MQSLNRDADSSGGPTAGAFRGCHRGKFSSVGLTLFGVVFWQLTIDSNDPALARFWAQALDYQPVPPPAPVTTWQAHYLARLGEEASFDNRLFDPDGLRPPIWFQEVPETKAGKTGFTSTCTPPVVTTPCHSSAGSKSSKQRSQTWSS